MESNTNANAVLPENGSINRKRMNSEQSEQQPSSSSSSVKPTKRSKKTTEFDEQYEKKSNGIEVFAEKSAFKRRGVTYLYKNIEHKSLKSFFNAVEAIFVKHAKKQLQNLHSVKSNALFEVVFCRKFGVYGNNNNDDDDKNNDRNKDRECFSGPSDDIENTKVFYMQSKMKPMLPADDLHKWFNEKIVYELQEQIDRVQGNGSGYTLYQINSMNVALNKYKRFSSAGASYIDLPPSIKKKKACINVKNTDNRCFMWAILSALHHDDVYRHNSTNQYKKFIHELDFNGLEFPMKVSDIDRFEELNRNISVNVYFFTCEYNPFNDCRMNVVQPLRLAKNPAKNHVNLLLLTEYKNDTAIVEQEEGIGCGDEIEGVCPPDIYDFVDLTKKNTLCLD